MRKMEITIAETNELTEGDITKINRLKNQHWEHELDEHMRWFKENIKSDDWHIMIQEEERILAYLNLINICVTINKLPYNMFGIGNVCVDRNAEHSGIGMIIMSVANAFIKQNKTCGLLLCHDRTKEFYKKTGWKQVDVSDALIGNNKFDLCIMAYDPYSIICDEINTLIIDRDF